MAAVQNCLTRLHKHYFTQRSNIHCQIRTTNKDTDQSPQFSRYSNKSQAPSNINTMERRVRKPINTYPIPRNSATRSIPYAIQTNLLERWAPGTGHNIWVTMKVLTWYCRTRCAFHTWPNNLSGGIFWFLLFNKMYAFMVSSTLIE